MLQLRRARGDDLSAVERLLTENELPLDGVREALDDFVVACDGDEVVGVAGLEVRRENALLRSVAVAPEARSRGVGRALVAHVMADAKTRKLRGLYLLTTTAAQYFPAFGFVAVERDVVPDDIRATVEFQSACPASATVMHLSLS